MDREYKIEERAVLVSCQKDVAKMERRCYVRLLRKNGEIADAQCNGCDDMQGGEPCISCMEQVKNAVLRGEV